MVEIQDGKESPKDLSILQKGMIMKYGEERKITQRFGKLFLTNVLEGLTTNNKGLEDNDIILGAYKKTQDYFRDEYLSSNTQINIPVAQEK